MTTRLCTLVVLGDICLGFGSCFIVWKFDVVQGFKHCWFVWARDAFPVEESLRDVFDGLFDTLPKNFYVDVWERVFGNHVSEDGFVVERHLGEALVVVWSTDADYCGFLGVVEVCDGVDGCVGDCACCDCVVPLLG